MQLACWVWCGCVLHAGGMLSCRAGVIGSQHRHSKHKATACPSTVTRCDTARQTRPANDIGHGRVPNKNTARRAVQIAITSRAADNRARRGHWQNKMHFAHSGPNVRSAIVEASTLSSSRHNTSLLKLFLLAQSTTRSCRRSFQTNRAHVKIVKIGAGEHTLTRNAPATDVQLDAQRQSPQHTSRVAAPANRVTPRAPRTLPPVTLPARARNNHLLLACGSQNLQ
jgi:hypothetical protein